MLSLKVQRAVSPKSQHFLPASGDASVLLHAFLGSLWSCIWGKNPGSSAWFPIFAIPLRSVELSQVKRHKYEQPRAQAGGRFQRWESEAGTSHEGDLPRGLPLSQRAAGPSGEEVTGFGTTSEKGNRLSSW